MAGDTPAAQVAAWDGAAWAPLMWPIKAIMTAGIGLMILQAISIFFKDLAKFMERDIA